MPHRTSTETARAQAARPDQPGGAPADSPASESPACESAGPEGTGDEGAEQDESAIAGDAAGISPPPPRRLLAPGLLAVAAVILGTFGVWATVTAHTLRGTAAGQNTALTDQVTTSHVIQQVSKAVGTIFSYSYTDTARTKRAAQALLTGPAIRQYNNLFALVEREAPAQKLVVTTKVTNAGVEFLGGGRARVLIFANQQDTRAGTRQSSYGGAMFAVTAIQQAGRWKIENIDTFTPSG